MKTRRLFSLFCIVLAATLLAGCATTRISVRTSQGLVVDFSCSKNVRAELIKVNPQTGEVEIKKVHTDAASVIDAQAGVAAATAGAVTTAAATALLQ